MKPAPFTYHRPSTREEVDELLGRLGEQATVLAGGQSLVPLLNMRLAAPGHLVDINHLGGEPTQPAEDDGAVCFGPLVRQAVAEESGVVRERLPLVALALRHIAHPAIRSRGTVIGSVAHADPAAELPPVLVLLGAQVRARRDGGTRSIPAEDFFVGPLENALDDEEWVEQVRVPDPGGPRGYGFAEYAQRRGDYALCGVAAVAEPAGDRVRLTLAYLGMGDVPQRLDVEPLSPDEAGGPGLQDAVDEVVRTRLEPPSDVHATPAYRRWLARRLGARAARDAAGRLGETAG